MTIRNEIRALGMREAREKWRTVVTEVKDGQPILILRDLQPSAVMLQFDEVQRWRRIEEAISALHGLEIYPELARRSAELAALVQERCFYHLEAPVVRVAGWDTPYPHAYEWVYFPGPIRLKNALNKVLEA